MSLLARPDFRGSDVENRVAASTVGSEQLGDAATAIVEFRATAARTANPREQHYLTIKTARLATQMSDD